MSRAAVLLGIWTVLFSFKTFEFLSTEEVYKSYLFTDRTSLRMISHDRETTDDYSLPDCDRVTCSWLEYTDNAVFEASYPSNMPLYEEADIDIVSLHPLTDPPIRCIPESFGYSKEQAAKVFPDVSFPSCDEVNKVKKDVLRIDMQTNTLTMTCPGFYWLGNGANEELLGKEQFRGEKIKYAGPVKLNDEEWAFGTCDPVKSTHVEGAAYSHRPREEVRQRVEETMQQLQKQAQETSGASQTHPLSVIMLTMDSISRRQFYRKLPKTHALLSAIDPSQFRVFDFKIHNVMGDNSLPNVWPVFTGKPLPSTNNNKRNRNKEQSRDLVTESSIWKYLRQQVRCK